MTTVVQTPQRVPTVFSKCCTRVINESVKYASLQGTGSYSVAKSASDYLFTVSLVISNVADGSRYFVEDVDTGEDLGTGVQSGTGDITVSAIGYTGAPRTVRIRVRKASGAPIYKPFETNAIVGATGGSSYVIQVPD